MLGINQGGKRRISTFVLRKLLLKIKILDNV